jgi:hypothetical protein
MFISEEIHRDLIAKFKANYKPYLATQENILLKSLNEVPGLYCKALKVEEGEHRGAAYVEIAAVLNATRLGMLNYGLLFDQFTNGMDQTTNMRTLVHNKLRPDDPKDPTGWPGIDTQMSLCYRVYVEHPDRLSQARYDTLFLMNVRVTKTKYAKSLVIKMED